MLSSECIEDRLPPCIRPRRKFRVALLHSEIHTQVLYQGMRYIHKDRDILLGSLLQCCGFLLDTPSFFNVVAPKPATRKHLEQFHDDYYIDLLEFENMEHEHETSNSMPSREVLDSVGLIDDCPLPASPSGRAALWKYCLRVAGGSLHAAQLLVSDKAEVALHWGGGRHHAHSNRASGFCYVNDVVLGVKKLRRRFSRILYIDIDIHHADGVQDAFYDTNEVMTVSFHRLANGFFPCTGAAKDKGRSNGIGYNLNVIIPRGCDDKNFIQIFKHALTNLLDAYKPDAVVLCVGADGLKDDPLVGNMDGWSLTAEGLAECVRTTSELCQGIKLLLLGGGGYDPVRAARTFLLCTAAACESARPGMLKNELPRDVPRHRHFPRYGPDFRLINESEDSERTKERDRAHELSQARNEIDLATLYLQARANKHHETPQFGAFEDEEDLLGFTYFDKKSSKKGRQRK